LLRFTTSQVIGTPLFSPGLCTDSGFPIRLARRYYLTGFPAVAKGIGPLWSVAPHCRVPFGSPVARLQLLGLAKGHPSYGALHLCYQDPSVHRPDFGSGEDLSPPGGLGLPIPVLPS
jgi:hypothetical protein